MALRQAFEATIKTKLLGGQENADLLGFGQPELSEQPQRPPSCWQIAYYQPYFNVDTRSAIKRLSRSVYRLGSKSFFGASGPDLYCPFWIITTLIICINIGGSEARHLMNNTDIWSKSISKVTMSAGLLYSLALFVPLICHCVLKYNKGQITYIELLSLYGYSWFLFIPASIVAIFPDNLVRATVILAVASWSYILLARNILREAAEAPPKVKYWLIGVSLSGHVIFVLSSLFYFYS